MRALHGVPLALDEISSQILKPWLGSERFSTNCPTVEVRVDGNRSIHAPLVEILEEVTPASFGRTATGLFITDRLGSWFTVEGSPPVVRGMLACEPRNCEDAQRNLLYSALLVALCKLGVYDLHAAALCTADRALILVGDSGAGKSTTATALLSAGYRYLGDDEMLIREFAGGIELNAVSQSFRLADRSLKSFAALRPYLSKPNPIAKWDFDARSAFPDQHLARWNGSTTLLFLQQSSLHSSTLSAVSLAEAVGHLIAQSSALGVECHPTPRQHLDLLARLASRSRLALLNLGSEWLESPVEAAHRLVALEQSFFS